MNRNIRRYIWIFALLAALAFLFDAQISRFFLALQSNAAVSIMAGISILGSWYIFPFLITLILLIRKRSRYLLPAWLSLILGLLIATIAKIIISRPRPFQALGMAATEKFSSWDSSFPSSHVIAVFAVLPFLDKKIKPYWLAFAILVALSRIYLGLHYASDVIAGAIIGYLCGEASFKIFKLK